MYHTHGTHRRCITGRGIGRLQKDILDHLPTKAEIEPYLDALFTFINYRHHRPTSHADEATALKGVLDAARVLNSCEVLQSGAVDDLTLAATESSHPTARRKVRRALHALTRRGLVGGVYLQAVMFDEEGHGVDARTTVRLVPGQQSYWYKLPPAE